MNKIYIWKNGGSDSDFLENANADFGNHSGGGVVIAASEEEARELIKQWGGEGDFAANSVEIDLSKKGVVLYADGQC